MQWLHPTFGNHSAVSLLKTEGAITAGIRKGRHHSGSFTRTTLAPTRIVVSPAWENHFNIAPLHRANIFQSDRTLAQRYLRLVLKDMVSQTSSSFTSLLLTAISRQSLIEQRMGSSKGRWLRRVNRLSVELCVVASGSFFFPRLRMLDQHFIDHTETWALETDLAPHNPSPPFAVLIYKAVLWD